MYYLKDKITTLKEFLEADLYFYISFARFSILFAIRNKHLKFRQKQNKKKIKK